MARWYSRSFATWPRSAVYTIVDYDTDKVGFSVDRYDRPSFVFEVCSHFISGKPRHEVFRWEMRKALDSARARVLALEDERAGSMVDPFWMFGIVTSRFGKIVCI